MKRILISLILFASAAFPAAAEKYEALDQADMFIRHTESVPFEKCGTPRLLNLLTGTPTSGGGVEKPSAFAAAYMTLGRPTLDRYADSSEGHFRVHYNITGADAPDLTDAGNNGVPDYVDSALVYLEYAWSTIIGLGYGAPKSDAGKGGSNAVDVYLQELSPQRYYGYTSPDLNMSASSSYIVIDNNYKESGVYPTTGYPALKVTTVHEFFHVIHYSYYGGDDAVWWMEQSAVWMEDYIWDDVNDYLNYIGSFLSNRDSSIDTNGPYMYSASLFAFMIAKKYGADMIRTLWNSFRDHQSGSIELFNPILPGGLAQAMGDLGVWTYFTGSRANPISFFTDSPLIKGMVTVQNTIFAIPALDSLTCGRYTFKYAEISPPGGFTPADTLNFTFTERDGGVWKKEIILFNSSSDFELVSLAGSNPALLLPHLFSKTILVIVNATPSAGNHHLVYEINIENVLSVGGDQAPSAFRFIGANPNPFNASVAIRFTMPRNGRATVRVYDILGRKAADLFDGNLSAGEKSLLWKPENLSGGVYLLRIVSPYGAHTAKVLLLK